MQTLQNNATYYYSGHTLSHDMNKAHAKTHILLVSVLSTLLCIKQKY